MEDWEAERGGGGAEGGGGRAEGGGGGEARMQFQRGFDTPLGLGMRTFFEIESTIALRSRHFSRMGVRRARGEAEWRSGVLSMLV